MLVAVFFKKIMYIYIYISIYLHCVYIIMFNVYILYSDPCFSPNQICLKKCRGPLIQRAVSPSVPWCDALRPLWSLEGHGNPDLLMIQRIFEVAGSRFWPCFAPVATRTRGFADLYYPNLSNVLEMIILHDLNWSRESPSAMINELFQGMVTMTYEASGWFWLVQIMSMWLLDSINTYTLWLFNIAMENGPFIGGFTVLKNERSFHGYVSHNQRVWIHGNTINQRDDFTNWLTK